jgi:hypothetical protein
MKRTQSFSLYALLIAVLIHFIIVLLLVLLDQFKPVPPPEQPSEPKEERFKLSMKERPNIAKEALVKNEIPRIIPKRSIPRGEQMIQDAQPLPKPVQPKPSPP